MCPTGAAPAAGETPADGGAGPAGDGAEWGSAEREVQYAEPWTQPTDEEVKKLAHSQRFTKWLFFTIFSISFFLMPIFTDNILGHDIFFSYFMGIITIIFIQYLFIVSKKIWGGSCQKNGWENIQLKNKWLFHAMFVWSYTMLLYLIIKVIITSDKIQVNFSFEGLYLLAFFIIFFAVFITFWHLINLVPPLFSRNLIISFDVAKELLTKSNEPEFKCQVKSKPRVCIFKGTDFTITMRELSNETNIAIQTPRDQPERNRELREAVSAILEGRSWPPESGDGDAPDSARPEGEGA